MQQIASNGTELAYRVDGPASAPWLVVSNSLASDHRMWAPQLKALAAHHQVVRFDTRGHGKSAAPDGPYSLDLLVADVVGLMDALDIEHADYLGLSLGGMVGLGLALDHPDRVKRLICCAARADAPDDFAAAWAARIDLVEQHGMGVLVEPTMERWFTPSFLASQNNAAVTDLVRHMITTTSVVGYCGCAAALPGLNYGSRLGEIEPPVLYVAGATDVGAPAEVMSEMAAATPGSKLEVIEPAAHLVNLEQPERFTELALSFLASH
jgi:3-oxoadipate enol-lactonase